MDAASAFTTTNPTHQNYDSFVTKRNLVVKSNTNNYDYALIFDCDGVIIETEELHRLAYNAAFQQAGVEVNGEPVVWSTEYYDVLQVSLRWLVVCLLSFVCLNIGIGFYSLTQEFGVYVYVFVFEERIPWVEGNQK